MKGFKKITTIVLGLAVAVGSILWAPQDVEAGFSNIVVDNASFSQELDTAKWHVPNKDVVAENGKLIFSANSNEETRIITMEPVRDSGNGKALFSANYTMKLKKLPAGEKFVLGFSLATVESNYEEAGNIEVVFESSNGVRVKLVAYNDDGDATVLANMANAGVSVGNDFTVSAVGTRSGNLSVKINGKTLYDKECPISMEGRIGFLQTGKCQAEVASVHIVSYKYDTPENVNFTEDFESGNFNANVLHSKLLAGTGHYPSGIQVEDYEGSKVLMYRNSNVGYLTTKYQYSNFEMSFDVPYIMRENILDENGKVTMPGNMDITVIIGADVSRYTAIEQVWQNAPDALLFNNHHVFSNRYINNGVIEAIDNKGLWKEGTTEGYSIKISMVDTKVKVFVKALDAKDWIQVLDYKIGNETPTGYIQIVSGYGRSNFAIDNLKVTNKDENAKVIKVDFKSGDMGFEDYDYEQMEKKYRDGELNSADIEGNQSEQTNNEQTKKEDKAMIIEWYYIVLGSTVAVGIVLIVVVLLVTRKKSKGNGGQSNEET